ncbi:acyl-CoA thioesterase [bacterium]|nr:acyl-CoA thioesterase [bacterium]
MKGNPVSATYVEKCEIVLPNDANILGNILGGKVMHLMDIACAIAAHRHCRRPVVTASMDNLDFLHPIKVGELVIVKAAVNRVFRSSMECGAKVISENLQTGELKHTSSAYLTFVALDDKLKPMQVAPVIPETDVEKRRWSDAAIRREFRMAERERLKKNK